MADVPDLILNDEPLIVLSQELKEMNIDILKVELRYDEGLRLKPYRCSAGAWTIGYGHNLTANGFTDKQVRYLFKDGIGESQAELQLDSDIRKAIASVKDSIPNFDFLTEKRQRALANMMFNLGRTGFDGFKNMIKSVKLEHWDAAAEDMKDSKWYKQVPNRANRLITMMREG